MIITKKQIDDCMKNPNMPPYHVLRKPSKIATAVYLGRAALKCSLQKVHVQELINGNFEVELRK